MESDFRYKSSTGEDIYAKKWMDEEIQNYKGIVQIVHGMQEHIERYTEFARFLAENGYIVVGHDHLGHGKTVKTEKDLGYFSEENGWNHLVEDIHILQNMVQHEYPELPYIIMGHSMGSLLVRTYLIKYKDNLQGVILSGTSGQKHGFLAGKMLIKTMMFFQGKHYRSKLIERLITGSFNKKFKPTRTKADWTTRDSDMVEEYQKDPKCGVNFTLQAYYDLVSGTEFVSKIKNVRKMQNIPILLFSGDKDPVGDMSKGVIRVYNMIKEAGIEKVRLKLFKDGRHEMLNEINKDEVYDFVLDWIDDLVK